jgi:hypothetical protein
MLWRYRGKYCGGMVWCGVVAGCHVSVFSLFMHILDTSEWGLS